MITNDELSNKYPQFLSKVYLETPAGWAGILDKLLENIQKEIDFCKEKGTSGTDEDDVSKFKIIQIKEKFSGLRFYCDFINDKIYNLIQEAEMLSYTSCEVCGEQSNSTSVNGWLRTLCPDHLPEEGT